MIAALIKLAEAIPSLMSLVTMLRDAWSRFQEAQHQRAIAKAKKAKTKAEMEEAVEDLSRNP